MFVLGVKEVLISSIFIKKHFKLTRIIRQVNDLLRVSAKEITSSSSVTTTLLEKFYGEMVCTWTMTVSAYSPVTLLIF